MTPKNTHSTTSGGGGPVPHEAGGPTTSEADGPTTREAGGPASHGTDGTTRRRFLGGLGTVGLAGLGSTPGRANGATDSGIGSGIGPETGSASGDSPETGDPLTDPDELEAFVDDAMAGRIGEVTPGATVAVVQGETAVLTKGYGTAAVGDDVPVRADGTPFRVGSVGKLVTFTAVVQGVERGVLDLDEDVNEYLEDSEVTVPDTDDGPVTLRQLGTHTAGFESALDPGIVADRDELSPLETLLADCQPSLVRPPGETVGYSNYGAALAGHVVAEVHDTTFEEYVQSEIFDPLGMTHSTFAQPVPRDHPGHLAAGHVRDGQTFATADRVFIDMRPAGSMSATASDVAAFMSAHLGGGAVGNARIMDPETTRTMHERHHVRHPAVTNWRYGFHEYGDPNGDLIGHSGATIHFTSHLVLAPGHDVGIFVNYNTNGSEPPAAVVDEIVAEYDLQPAPPSPTATATTTATAAASATATTATATTATATPGGRDRAETVAGEYGVTSLPRSGPLQVVDVLDRVSVEPASSGRLRTETLDGPTRKWIETEPYVYREDGGHDVLAFEVEAGDVEAMYASSEPTGVRRPVPLHERQLVTGGVLAGALTGFGLSTLGWSAAGAWRRWNDRITGTDTDAGELE